MQLVRPNAVAIAVSVVRMMLTITDHLAFFSVVIMIRDFFSEITIQSEDRTRINQYLCKHIEHTVMYLARWRQEQGDERHRYSRGE